MTITFFDKSLSQLSVDQALERAFSCYDTGASSQAEELCRLILDKVPGQVDAMQLLGAVLNEKGRYAEAAQLLRQAIRQAPGNAHLHNNLALALHRLGNSDEAVRQFARAIEIRPDFAKAHNNLAAALMKLGRIDDAVAACRQAIALRGDFKEAYNNLGLALKKKGLLKEAIETYDKAVSLDGKYAEALSNLGMALIEQGRFNKAAVNLQKAVGLVPNSAEFINNLSVVFNRQGRFEQAAAASKKAIAIRANYVQAHNNLGTALMELGRFADANAAFDRAIAIEPQCAEAHHNRSLVLLLTAQFEQGWAEYEWRWRHEGFSTPARPFSQKRWNGSAEGVGKLLVWAEQGIGDEVQFSALIRHITAKGIEVIVECDRRLVTLLKRSFPGITVVGRTDPPAARLKDRSITHQIPMASIPLVLGLSPNSMPYQAPFLIPDGQMRNRFRSEYKRDAGPLLVGISWRSGNTQEGAKRSVGLEHWAAVLKITAAQFVNLQYGDCSKELQDVGSRLGVQILEDEKVDPIRDLESFAAQVAAMDLVISVDNSTVHFAGALGVEVWTMLPAVPDWRWGLAGDKTRWYPTMRLFRRRQKDNWQPVISSLAEELALLIKRSEKR